MTVLALLKESSFFSGWGDEHLQRIAGICHEETHRSQETILQEGDKAHKLYILHEGSIAIQIRVKKYQDIIISTINEKGALFGWSAVVEPHTYTSTVKCLEETGVVSINGEELEKVFTSDPGLGLTFMKKIAGLIDSRLVTMRKRLIGTIS